ncbi:MAG: MerR family transcriptional regulator [Rubricoccaceae bacterium]
MNDVLSVGELAAQTGLTVRTLHHYEAEGLLSPERTPAGHRRYGPRQVERLQRIASLRAIGTPLSQIRTVLDAPGFDPLALVETHRETLITEAARMTALANRLDGLARLLRLRAETGAAITPDTFLAFLKTMNDIEKHYTPEQLQQLAERREALGEDTIRSVEAEWPKLFEKVGREMDAGTDPADPSAQALIDRWDELVGMFTGGNADIQKSLGTVWKSNTQPMSEMMGLDPERMQKLFAYAQRVRDAR